MKRIIARTVATGVGLTALALVRPAHAYNWKTHSRMTEVALQIMQSTSNPSAAPEGIDPQQWTKYLSAIKPASTKLGLLQSGVSSAGADNGFRCDYDLADDMSQIPYDRIQDMSYLPVKGGQLLDGNPVRGGSCSEQRIKCEADKALRVGQVLGWQGASADEHLDDTKIWIRPTLVFLTSVVTSVASYAVDVAAASLVFPFVCLVDILSGDGCSFSHSFDLANQYNPVTELTGLLPGFDLKNSYDYVGLWHFIDVSGVGTPFEHNTPRGLLYEQAGPHNVPGTLDVGIMAAADLFGMAIHASASKGVEHYGKYDQVHRTDPQWQAISIGHVDFSPVSNLARYGWDTFVSNPKSAYGLSFPLHALGDAAEPHHVAGTTSWGHRPYEDEVDSLLDTQLLPPPDTCSLLAWVDTGSQGKMTSAQSLRILIAGFRYWNQFQSQFKPGQVPVQDMVKQLANDTWANADAGVYNDWASVVWEYGHDVAPSQYNTSQTDADNMYKDDANKMRPLLELGTGAMIAFLTGASQTVQDPGPNPDQHCPSGTSYNFQVGACVTTPPPNGGYFSDAGLSPIIPPPSACTPDTPPCTTSADCTSNYCIPETHCCAPIIK